ncbi:LysR family transcriptional regulator [Glaciimonas sp. GS1]|uniref:LysR family transcriptional regulator n=2 Tax=Glaciimonas soli TaxID=2590999 RepID=A0A843YSF4_9BURK|nr:LysR family transcriptional regulator [Glaciimonas soli]
MLTFKQIEAVHWVGKLGSFAAAADKLNTTQSAISKRLAEIEMLLDVQLFDRSRRTARLTEKGQEILALGEEMLLLRERFIASAGRESIAVRRFRIGVTELTALTWLPSFVQAFRHTYPDVELQPEIDVSVGLCEKLKKGAVDLIIVPPVFNDVNFEAIPLKELTLAWMCSPELCTQRKTLTLQQITAYPVLMQVERSGVDVGYDRWFREKGLSIQRIYAGNSLIALSALTMLGFGVSYLPAEYFSDLAISGQLQVLRSDESLPKVPYFAVYRSDGPIAFSQRVAVMAEEFCDFSKPVTMPRIVHKNTPPHRNPKNT